jgi:hypothetical protein
MLKSHDLTEQRKRKLFRNGPILLRCRRLAAIVFSSNQSAGNARQVEGSDPAQKVFVNDGRTCHVDPTRLSAAKDEGMSRRSSDATTSQALALFR